MRLNDAFRLIENPDHAGWAVFAILVIVALCPEILTWRVLI